MNIEKILAPERTRCGISATSQKRALEEVSVSLAATIEDIEAEEIFSSLISREKMGSTAIGHGIAIPHCRLDGCPQILGGLFTLEGPVDFQAFDDEGVRILFVLLVPTEEVDEHLQVLAMLAKRFDSESYRQQLVKATSDDELYRLATRALDPAAKQAQN